VESCPEQCNECGDGVVYGGEVCDDGAANQTYWPTTPPAGACSEACDEVFTYCGDGMTNGGEECDAGAGNQTYWPFEPPLGACSKGCDEVFTYCGDGVLDEPQEGCDDGNGAENDGCTETCKAECVMFVTEEAFAGDLGGEDPDAVCQEAAEGADLYGAYVAWMWYGGASAGERVTPCSTPVLRRDGAVIAADWAAFVSDEHGARIDRTAANGVPNTDNTGGAVWTGTNVDGSGHMSRCDDWTSVDMNAVGRVGDLGVTDADWTSSFSRECNKLAHLYCIQQPE
jgi:cysteine-rich repeat protein